MCQYCFICPTYGHYDYARAAIDSFMRHTPNGVAIVVDDAHPGFYHFWSQERDVIAQQFSDHAGLTRSWNFGLTVAQRINAKYSICGNDDILFSPGWWEAPSKLLENDSIALVGPLSNGPGVTNKLQNVWDHIPDYSPSDSDSEIAHVASQLRAKYRSEDHYRAPINGFFMIGRTSKWWTGRFDQNHVFNPDSRFALTGNEDELQVRFRMHGWTSAVSLHTFIFHYRSVTRGESAKHGMWYRRQAK